MGNGGLCTKVWYYKCGSSVNMVMLRHDTIRKQKRLFLNGKEVADLSDEKFDHVSDVALDGGRVGTIKVETFGMVLMEYKYTFFVDGKEIPSYNDIEDKNEKYRVSAYVKSVERKNLYVIEAIETFGEKEIAVVKTDHSMDSFQSFLGVLKSYNISVSLESSEKDQINDFLKQLLSSPQISHNPDVRKFLGLSQNPHTMPKFASSKHIVLDFSAI
jgi:hypothetical protein